MKNTLKKALAVLLTSAALLSFGGCSSSKENKTIRVGASPAPHAQILEVCKEPLAKKGYTLEIVEFTDYVLPNQALDSGDLEANFFQHTPYLQNFCENNNMDLVSAVKVHFEPLGIYKGKSDDLQNIKDGATIAVPNDATNEARALQLLAANGIIALKEGVGLTATKNDIVSALHNVEIIEMEAAQLPRTLPDVDFAVINGNYALDADIIDSLLLTEDPASDAAQEFANILAVRSGDENSESIKALVEVLTSETVKTFIHDTFGSTVVAVF